MKTRCGTVNRFFDILSELKNGNYSRTAVNDLMDHPDYAVEFERYTYRQEESRIGKEDFLRLLESFGSSEPEICKKVVKERKAVLESFTENLTDRKQQWKNFSLSDSDIIVDAAEIAMKGLPAGTELDDIELMFTISIGNSFGWAHRNVVHFDVVQLCSAYKSITEMKYFLAHEIHHIGFTRFLEKNETEDAGLIFLQFLAYEGLAVKFCNYPSGNYLSRCLNPDHKNNTIDRDDWEYFQKNSDHYFNLFINDYKTIMQNKHDSPAEIIYQNWKTENRLDGRQGFRQYPNYFIGFEIFGTLIDDYGTETVYDILCGRAAFPEYFNESMKKRGLDYCV